MMALHTQERERIRQAVDELPSDSLSELAAFIEYLRFKTTRPGKKSTERENTFLLSIAGLGAGDEQDVSERDEEILATEIDPIRGWTLEPEE